MLSGRAAAQRKRTCCRVTPKKLVAPWWSSVGAVVLLSALTLTGCGGADPGAGAAADAAPRSVDHGDQGDHGDHGMAGMDMGGSADAPSSAAAMICSNEIVDAVGTTFALSSVPEPTDAWSDQLYTCSYSLPQGPLTLTVDDAPDASAGKAYFIQLRDRLESADGVHPIKGLAGLGLPSYESDNGHVVFMKDGKTLHVDASQLDLPGSRTTAAYQIATDVIACWSE